MSNSKRLPQFVGATVVTGAIVFSSSGVAHASEAPEQELDAASSNDVSVIPGDHVETLAKKYGVATADADTAATTSTKTEEKKDEPKSAESLKKDEPAKAEAAQPGVSPAATEAATQEAATVECKDNSNAVSRTQLFVNGAPVSSLQGNVKPGDNVRAGVTASDNCEGTVNFGLAGYEAPSDAFSPETADQQMLVTKSTVALKAGQTGWININAPQCFFQIDLFVGGVLDTLGPEGSDNFYEGRLLATATGGTFACGEEGGGEGNEGDEGVPTEVLSSEVNNEAPVVLAASNEAPASTNAPENQVSALADTGAGMTTMPLIALGSTLTLLGAAMERASRRMRRAA